MSMDDFDLDLLAVEGELDDMDDADNRIVLGVLDGTTPPNEWIGAIREGLVLVLAIEGDLNELAAGFARKIKDMGGHLVHFRGFLVITPPGIPIDTDRLE
jgi:predicted transcriptional regulator